MKKNILPVVNYSHKTPEIFISGSFSTSCGNWKIESRSTGRQRNALLNLILTDVFSDVLLGFQTDFDISDNLTQESG